MSKMIAIHISEVDDPVFEVDLAIPPYGDLSISLDLLNRYRAARKEWYAVQDVLKGIQDSRVTESQK